MALSLAASDQLHKGIVPVLVQVASDEGSEKFRNRLREVLLDLRIQARKTSDDELLINVEKGLALLDTVRVLKESKGDKRIALATKALEGAEFASQEVALPAIEAVLSNEEIKKDNPDLIKHAKRSLESLAERAVEAVVMIQGQNYNIEESQRELDHGDQLQPEGGELPPLPGTGTPSPTIKRDKPHAKFLSMDNQQKQRKAQRQVEEVYKVVRRTLNVGERSAIGGQTRFVIVYSDLAHREEVRKLQEWGQQQQMIVVVERTNEIGKPVVLPEKVELRFNKNGTEAASRALEIQGLLLRKLNQELELAGKPGHIIAINEFEIWFPEKKE